MRLRLGVVGHRGRGDFGHKILEGFQHSPLFEIVGVLDLGSRAAQTTDTEFIEPIRAAGADLLVVAQRFTDSHERLVEAALEAGLHVYCEKPLVQDLAAADRLAELASQRGLQIGVALPAAHEHRFRLLQELLAEGRIGTIREVRGIGKWDHRGGGEDALILGLHLTDLMRRLIGEPISCLGSISELGVDIRLSDARSADEGAGLVAGDHFHAVYRFPGGVIGSLSSRRAGISERDMQPYRLEIHGDDGLLVYRAPYADGSIWFYPHPAVIPGRDLWQPIHIQPTTYDAYHTWAAEDMWGAIVDDRRPRSDVGTFIGALEMIHGAYVSSLDGRVTSFPLGERNHPLARANG